MARGRSIEFQGISEDFKAFMYSEVLYDAPQRGSRLSEELLGGSGEVSVFQ